MALVIIYAVLSHFDFVAKFTVKNLNKLIFGFLYFTSQITDSIVLCQGETIVASLHRHFTTYHTHNMGSNREPFIKDCSEKAMSQTDDRCKSSVGDFCPTVQPSTYSF